MDELIKIEAFSQSSYRKCECCSRVRDIYFRVNVYDYESHVMLVGSFELCKGCGNNFGKIINQKEVLKMVNKGSEY